MLLTMRMWEVSECDQHNDGTVYTQKKKQQRNADQEKKSANFFYLPKKQAETAFLLEQYYWRNFYCSFCRI